MVPCDIHLVEQYWKGCVPRCAANLILLQIENSMEAFGTLWVGHECHKSHFLEEWAWCLLRGLQVLNKNPTGMELEAFLQSQRADGGLDLAMEYKGTPPVVGGFSSPMRARVDCHKSSR